MCNWGFLNAVCRRLSGSLIRNSAAIMRLAKDRTSGTTNHNHNSTSNSSLCRHVERLKFYWGTSNPDAFGSAPKELFQITAANRRGIWDESKYDYRESAATLEEKPVYWPTGGLAVKSGAKGSSETLLLVIGQVVAKVASTKKPTNSSTVDASSSTIVNTEGNQNLYIKVAASVDFRELGSALMIVSNPHDPPDLWDYEHVVIPKSIHENFRWFVYIDMPFLGCFVDD